jgi:hypothetical protein
MPFLDILKPPNIPSSTEISLPSSDKTYYLIRERCEQYFDKLGYGISDVGISIVHDNVFYVRLKITGETISRADRTASAVFNGLSLQKVFLNL